MHQYECNKHQAIYFSLEKQIMVFYKIFPIKKTNVGKILKLREIVVQFFFLLTSRNLEILGCDISSLEPYSVVVILRLIFY
jgi:hypothetical protein